MNTHGAFFFLIETSSMLRRTIGDGQFCILLIDIKQVVGGVLRNRMIIEIQRMPAVCHRREIDERLGTGDIIQ